MDAAENINSGKLLKLPREYYEKSNLLTGLFLVYSTFLYVFPSLLIYWVIQRAYFDVPLRIVAVLLLGLVAQQGLHLFGWIGHEGFHFNLVDNRMASAAIGLFFSALIFTHMGFGFALSHWDHHRFTNMEEDPDRKIFGRFKSFLPRLLFARMTADWYYFKDNMRVAFGNPKKGYPLTSLQQYLLAWGNVLASTGWFTLYVWIIWRHPLAGFAAIGYPHILVVMFTGLRPYFEHAGTETNLFQSSRTRVSVFLSTSYFFNNYHLEHHLYPKIPCYNLPKVHRYLKGLGVFAAEKSLIERGGWKDFRYATKRFQYKDLGFGASTPI